MESVPEARTNNNVLLSVYWQVFDNVGDVKDLPLATPAESITRRIREVTVNIKEKNIDERNN